MAVKIYFIPLMTLAFYIHVICNQILELWVHHNGEEALLPGLSNFNQRQLFWIRNAQQWCYKHSDDDLRRSLYNDEHTPSKYRLIGSLMLSDEFANDFNCSPGTPMNPNRSCKIGSLWPESPLSKLHAGKYFF